MPLDIGLAASKSTSPYPTMRFSFDDDGYYWFCHPFFEDLASRTGQMIDLYDGAWFSRSQFDELETTLTQIRDKVFTMPQQWQQCTGHSVGSYLAPTPPMPIYAPVERDNMLALIAQFEQLVEEAKQTQSWIACLGD